MKALVSGKQLYFTEADVIAGLLEHIETHTQLGIGVMVSPADLHQFLLRAGVAP